MMAVQHTEALFLVSLTVGANLFLAACGQTPAPTTPPAQPSPIQVSSAPTSPAAPTAASGKQLFETHCTACHGRLGEGGKAPDGTVAPPLSAHLRVHAGLPGGTTQIVRAVLDGIHEEGGHTEVLDKAMPRFRGTLSESDVTAIVDYMQTLP